MSKNWLEDPNLLDKARSFNEAVGIHRHLDNRAKRRSNSAKKGVKTRKRNELIKGLVLKQLEEERKDTLAFLPIEFRDESRKITVTEYINLSERFPDKIKIIENLYNERRKR